MQKECLKLCFYSSTYSSTLILRSVAAFLATFKNQTPIL